ncbi:MAG: ester cyclase [Rhodospirillales bacterium]|nr:ester cyclase [Rhodospirillales bacterium]
MKSVVEGLHAIWNSGDLEAIPDIYSTDFVVHWSKSAKVPDSHGHAGVKAVIEETRTAFPDWHENVVDMVIEGDRVVTRYISTGTHKGPFEGIPPTGKPIEIDEISIYRIEGGKIAEQWCMADDLALLNQLKS